MVEEMANDLLAGRSEGPVGKHWVQRFKTRVKEIRLQSSRPYNCQQALNEDACVKTCWFELVKKTMEKYCILDEDIRNFDKSGFMLGVIKSQIVFTASEKRSNLRKIRPGSREWVAII